jgi:transmembrane sensor
MRLFRKHIKKESDHLISKTNGIDSVNLMQGFEVPMGKTKEQAWNDLLYKITSMEKSEAPVFPFYKRNYYTLAIAASVTLLLAIGISVLYFSTNVSITCPRGEQMSVRLPDQSSVLLNSETRISYNKVGWKLQRKVIIKGEVFFNVQKGERFTVKTDVAEISVLGTSFNVFAREGEVKVNCFTGKVSVKNRSNNPKTVILPPGKETTVLRSKQPAEPKAFDIKKGARWRIGEFYFINDKIAKVISELERQYKVSIEYNGDTNRYYTGSFTNRNLTEALDLLCIPMNMKYSKNNNSIKINQQY